TSPRAGGPAPDGCAGRRCSSPRTPATARRWGTAGGTASARRGFGGWSDPPARGNSPGSSCDAGGPGKLRVPVRLLVEPSVGRDLLELEPLHRNGVERATLDAQGT